MLGKFIINFIMICLLSLVLTLIVLFFSAILMYIIEQFKQFEEFKEFKKRKRAGRLNAWKVEPELADRFLDVLTNNDYKWMSGHKANEFCPMQEDAPLLFIEGVTKGIYYTRYFSYPDNLEEQYNVTEVTEEWLQRMEKKQ